MKLWFLLLLLPLFLSVFILPNFTSSPSSGAAISLNSFTPQLGDATWACQNVIVGQNDINQAGSSLTSNVNKKAAQVHAYSSYKQYGAASTLLYTIHFSIPYQPKPDINQAYNPQTIESEAVIYYNGNQVKYNVGIQWALNPWMNPEIHVWRNGVWVAVLTQGITPNATYRYVLYLDRQSSQNSYVRLEMQSSFLWWTWWNAIGQWQSYSSQSRPTWGSDSSWWVSAENISASPSPNCSVGFINTSNWYAPSVSAS